ncbi:GmrSD restriction endonuclease domain-containing protein [Pseudoroseomonas sp. WGS1072]|uniref:GmrSD restriction endonuclease domain-containing protein n=1 Tax=Roseomonas sp. WGS1072 TaxID=3366816 RepID=UPI003BF0CDC5
MTAETTFDATSDTLSNLLSEVSVGRLQLPDFQRGWVWDDEHIAAVITSVARSFPIGAVMTLQTGGEVRFQPRPVEGVSFKGEPPLPDRLLLDGQQRLTSMFQALMLKHAIRTRDGKRRLVDVFYYVDIAKALGTPEEREDAVFSVPADKRRTTDFGRKVLLDLSTPEQEYAALMFPLNHTFSCEDWFDGFRDHWDGDKAKKDLLKPFRKEFIDTFKSYAVPVIQLRRTASKEAVCRVFEKVNTGGVALTAFELLTATYAADGFNLREDWLGDPKAAPPVQGRKARMAEAGKVLEAIEATDFLQAVSLLYTAASREQTEAGQGGKGIPSAISCTRQSILDLPLKGYRDHADRAEEGFKRARQFLWREMVFSGYDLPYRTQLVPLAAILVSLGDRWNDASVRARVRNWFWCGVFGELYGSAIESRFARDLPEVVAWALGGEVLPQTVQESNFVTDRLRTLQSRQSAAYKGLHALTMQGGRALDWRTGSTVQEQTYFDESIDIHHIFPRAWCEKNKLSRSLYNSIANKTALSAPTNRFLGGDAPSTYLRRLQDRQKLTPEQVDGFLASHLIDPARLRADDLMGMMVARAEALAALITDATGRPVGGRSMAEAFGMTILVDDLVEESAA